MPLAPAFESLDLGNLAQTPVKIGGIYSQGKRTTAQKVVYGAEHALAVCQSFKQIMRPFLTNYRRSRKIGNEHERSHQRHEWLGHGAVFFFLS